MGSDHPAGEGHAGTIAESDMAKDAGITPEIADERFTATLTELQNTPSEELTVAGRLILRSFDRQFTITVESERGPIAIVCWIPTPAQHGELLTVQHTIHQARRELAHRVAAGTAKMHELENGRDRIQALSDMGSAVSECKDQIAQAERRLPELLAALTTDPTLDVGFFTSGILNRAEIEFIVTQALQRGARRQSPLTRSAQ